ncbi:diguanylate cyclase [uncultured Desulfosarcina sp.]|uniref:GGDEF domain-containing protein n=1 Tax=uncultured Desulfosarcina sp. TaxID=218289 RepID=UPI0029C94072|nr:diguanylate cyclase [uncultured Desulfosarcina sp.]
MHYDDTIEESQHYLRLALTFLGKYSLPTDPLNYCVWYEYSSGRNEDLNAAIDACLGSEAAFSKDAIRSLFDLHIAGSEEKVSKLVREKLKKLFIEVIGAVQTTNQHFSESETNLEAINDTLKPSLSEADIEKIVNQIKSEINKLKSSSTSFKERLKQATSEIDRLKARITRYRKEARLDPLTGIANRRGFEKRLIQTIDDANTNGFTLCAIMADIDHFKRVNDTHGHTVGDNVIRMVAATIKDTIKGKDLAARIGGEEFAILLPDTPIEGATILAEKMRLTFEQLDLKKKNTGERLGKITLSFGVTSYKTGESADSFMNRADQALYQSKKTGRNKVTGL